MQSPPPDELALWSAAIADATPEEVLAQAERLLDELCARGAPGLIDLDQGRTLLGWHPLPGRFRVSRRMEEAPAHLPLYLAVVVEAPQVHAVGESFMEAAERLLALVRTVADQLASDAG